MFRGGRQPVRGWLPKPEQSISGQRRTPTNAGIMQRWIKFSPGWTRMVSFSAALFLGTCGANAAAGRGRAGAPGQSSQQDIVSWETLAASPAAAKAPGRVSRKRGEMGA